MKQKILVVVDVQNDSCHPMGFFPKRYSYGPRIEPIVDNIERAIDYWRSQNLPVVYTQYVWDRLSPKKQQQFSQRGLAEFYKEGEWGADFYRIRPEEGEMVFRKGTYSVFGSPEFREYIETVNPSNGLVLIGFFSDVCINATTQDAWELDIPTEIIADCSTNKTPERPHESQLRYMERFYGTHVHRNIGEPKNVIEKQLR